jgi:hypothetical protein
MSASSQSYPASALPLKPLTITEVEIEPAPLLGPSKIYFYAAAGTAFGILFGAAIAASLWLPNWLAQPSAMANAGVPAPAPVAPQGPRDFGSVKAIVAGLNGHLTTEWREKPTYTLVIEPSAPAQQPGFALAVTASPRPLSVGFQLLDRTGAVVCGQDVVVRYDASHAAALNAANPNSDAKNNASKTAGTQGSAEAEEALGRVEAQEMSRERGRDIFENEIGDDGQIVAIDAQGAMPCSKQAYDSAASWSFSADFPSVAEQADLLKRETETEATQKAAPARKPETGKKAEAHIS